MCLKSLLEKEPFWGCLFLSFFHSGGGPVGLEVKGCCQWLGGGIWSSALLPNREGTGKGAVRQCGGRGESRDLSGNGFAPGKGKGGAGVRVRGSSTPACSHRDQALQEQTELPLQKVGWVVQKCVRTGLT